LNNYLDYINNSPSPVSH